MAAELQEPEELEEEPQEDEGLGDTVRDADQDFKNLNKFRNKGKGGEGASDAAKGGAKAAGKEGAELAAEEEAAHIAEKRVAAEAAARLGAEAIGAISTGVGVVLAIPDLVRLAKSKWGKITIGSCCVCACLPFAGILFGGMILIAAIGGGQSGDSNNQCPYIRSDGEVIEDWSYELVDGNKENYKTALQDAEAITHVPAAILAAIDYEKYANGYQDDRDNPHRSHEQALIEIGKKVQETNELRDKSTGKLVLDENGKPIDTVWTDSVSKDNPNIATGIAILSNYRCPEVAESLADQANPPIAGNQKNEFINEFCYSSKGGPGNSTYTAMDDDWIMRDFVDDSVAGEIQKLNPVQSVPYLGTFVGGVLKGVSTAKQLLDSLANVPGAVWSAKCHIGVGNCETPEIGAATWLKVYLDGDELIKSHTVTENGKKKTIPGCPIKKWTGGSSNGSPSSGSPGQCVNGIAQVPEFFQFSPPWASIPIDESGDNVRAGGCGLTSLTMVLNWYGKGVTPADTITWLDANPPVCYSGGWTGCMYPKVAQHWGMNAGFNTIGWAEAEQKLRNCQPVIVANNSGSWAYTWHLVVLTGIDSNNNVHVNDPFPRDMKTGQYTVPLDTIKSTIGNIIDVY